MVSLAAVNLPAPPDRKVTLVIATKPRGGRVVVPTGSALVRAPAAHASCVFTWTFPLTFLHGHALAFAGTAKVSCLQMTLVTNANAQYFMVDIPLLIPGVHLQDYHHYHCHLPLPLPLLFLSLSLSQALVSIIIRPLSTRAALA